MRDAGSRIRFTFHSVFLKSFTAAVFQAKQNSKILARTRLGEKPSEGFNNNSLESYNLRSMFTDFQNPAEIDADFMF